jgi:hypothetical protein
MLISLSMLNRLISPFIKLLIRGCVSPKKSAASACVHPRARMYSRKSIIKSALILRFAASSLSNPRSSNTLSLPWMNLISSNLPTRAAPVLDRAVTLPADLDIAPHRLLGFLFGTRVRHKPPPRTWLHKILDRHHRDERGSHRPLDRSKAWV